MTTINATNTPGISTNGQVIIGSTDANPVVNTLTAGSNVTVTNGAGTITVAASTGASITFIATATASSSASINFDNNLTSTYDNYLVIIENLLPASNNVSLYAQFGTGGTPTYSTSTYSGTMAGENSSSPVAWQGASNGVSTACVCSHSSGGGLTNTANKTSGFYINIFGANNSNYKILNSFGIGSNTNGAGTDRNSNHICANTWATTTVITSIKFTMSSGNISSGIFKLYGYQN